MISQLKELYLYREMLKNLVSMELRARYKGSVLGFVWTFINPLLMLVIYSFVFSFVMRIKIENYSMFLFVGLLPWTFFQNSILMSSPCIVSNGNLVKKIYFPTEILPLSIVIANLLNYIFSLAILLPALYLFGIKLTGWISLFPIILLVQLILVSGISLLISSLNVYFRDLQHIVNVFLMAWFYITPILFPPTVIPENYKWLIEANPMAPIIIAYQDIFFYGKSPSGTSLFEVFLVALVISVTGFLIFGELKRNFAEEI
ncbi:ABC transporter permease [Candidatus Formimonas warabiya]|uniref:Transport permease protein n=1 Tax=Formimonas warabiya TaxID=1761012 RepID=A0A3G1KZ99_FORW1|nr:ABC transporter permease [Candidatus Formimonas warabiya]ATW27727.1 ABC transporter [Candidatus Formimonas warabiya]